MAYHIEVTKNGESVVSRDFEEVSIVENRHVSGLYKEGEQKAFTIAPSAKFRLTITADETVIPTGAEYYTMDDPD
jgi:hypothetical protein